MLSIFYGKIMTWSVTTKSFTQRTQSSNILQPDTLFREYRFIENRNSHNLFVSRELSLLCYLQSSPSLSLLSSAVVLKQVVPDSAEKVLCTRLCWHLLEWRIKEKGVNFQAGAQKKKKRHNPRQRQYMCKQRFVRSTAEAAVWALELELRWTMMKDHRQDQLQFWYVSKTLSRINSGNLKMFNTSFWQLQW